MTRRSLFITGDLLMLWLSGNGKDTTTDLPLDAEIVGCRYHPKQDHVELILSSSVFTDQTADPLMVRISHAIWQRPPEPPTFSRN